MAEQSQGPAGEPEGTQPSNADIPATAKTFSADRVQTPESGRPKSTASSDIVFEARKKKRKGTPTSSSEDGHDVTFTVTIAMAVPTGELSILVIN